MQNDEPLWFILQYRKDLANYVFNQTYSQYENGFGSIDEGKNKFYF